MAFLSLSFCILISLQFTILLSSKQANEELETFLISVIFFSSFFLLLLVEFKLNNRMPGRNENALKTARHSTRLDNDYFQEAPVKFMMKHSRDFYSGALAGSSSSLVISQ
jgi:hypothetical protein